MSSSFLKGRRIGILGGVGPESTAYFYDLLIKKIQSEGVIEENMDFPQIFINSIPAQELFVGENSESEKLQAYHKGIEDLNKHTLDLIVIICNSAHAYYRELQNKSNSPILNIIECVHNELKNGKKYLILGSGSAVNNGIYNFNDISVVTPSVQELKEIDQVIFAFNKGGNKMESKDKLLKVVEKYVNEEVSVILACTEIECILSDINDETIQPLDILAKNLIDSFKDIKFINRLRLRRR